MPRPAIKASGWGLTVDYEDNDQDWAQITALFTGDLNATVETGYFRDQHNKTRKVQGKRKASIMARVLINQFGGKSSNGGRIPARPFMTVGFDGIKDEIEKALADEAKLQFLNVGAGKSAEEATIGFLRAGAAFMRERLRRVIEDWSQPPNAALTVALKGFDDPLIETGEMAGAVTNRFKVKFSPSRPPRTRLGGLKRRPARGAGRGGRRASSGFGAGIGARINAALRNEAKNAVVMRAAKKSSSKKATATRFNPKARFKPGGSANRPTPS
jgi:hypothetical protein